MTLDDEGAGRRRRRRTHPLDEPSGPERMIALSDGVFSIAMTIMVFQLTVPTIANNHATHELGTRLLGMLPSVATYTIAFLIIASYWHAHRRIFQIIKRHDAGVTILNIILLMCIAFQPFPTAVLGAYSDDPAAVVLFAGTLGFTGLVMLVLWLYGVIWRRLVSVSVDRRLLFSHPLTFPSLVTPGVFLLSMAIAPFSARAAKFSWLLILLLPMAFEVYLRLTASWRSPQSTGPS
jgi:uncharacterized membrane protein